MCEARVARHTVITWRVGAVTCVRREREREKARLSAIPKALSDL